MVAVLLVCSIVGCTTDFAAEQPPKTPDDAAKLTNSRIDFTKNEGGNGNFTGDTEYSDTIDFEFLLGKRNWDTAMCATLFTCMWTRRIRASQIATPLVDDRKLPSSTSRGFTRSSSLLSCRGRVSSSVYFELYIVAEVSGLRSTKSNYKSSLIVCIIDWCGGRRPPLLIDS